MVQSLVLRTYIWDSFWRKWPQARIAGLTSSFLTTVLSLLLPVLFVTVTVKIDSVSECALCFRQKAFITKKKSQRIENWFSEDILLLLSHHLIFITFSGVTAHWSLRSRHIGIFGLLVPRIARTVFENHRKSIILHCEQSELRLHFEWTKVN